MSGGCYRCGSNLGSAVRPCPTCVGKRYDHLENPKHEVSRVSSSIRTDAIRPSRFSYSTIFSAIGAIFLISIALWANWTEIKIMTGTATANDIYNACLSGGQKMATGTKDDIGKAIVSGIMVEICDDIRQSCVSDPHGDKCEKARQMMKMMRR